MSAPIQPLSTPYTEELRAYHLRLAAFLGLDPTVIAQLRDVDRPQTDPSPIAMPPGVDVTWKTYDARQAAEPHVGRYPMPVSMRGTVGEPTEFVDGVHLDWSETDRMRAEVGERPQFPAPAGGWPAAWQHLAH